MRRYEAAKAAEAEREVGDNDVSVDGVDEDQAGTPTAVPRDDAASPDPSVHSDFDRQSQASIDDDDFFDAESMDGGDAAEETAVAENEPPGRVEVVGEGESTPPTVSDSNLGKSNSDTGGDDSDHDPDLKDEPNEAAEAKKPRWSRLKGGMSWMASGCLNN